MPFGVGVLVDDLLEEAQGPFVVALGVEEEAGLIDEDAGVEVAAFLGVLLSEEEVA